MMDDDYKTWICETCGCEFFMDEECECNEDGCPDYDDYSEESGPEIY